MGHKENPAEGISGAKDDRGPDYRPDGGESKALVEAALEHASRVPIFPCKNCPDDPDKHKTPWTKHGFKDASTDPDTIRKWWASWPNALIGMPTGPASGVDVLDLDNKTNKKGVLKNGFLRVPDWETRTPVIARTGSGGAHLYFKSDGTIRNTIDEIAIGIDTRGLGGYVIVPPSPGYSWVNGCDFSDLPPWPDDLRPVERPNGTPGENPEAELALVALALAVIPNPDLNWEEWNRIGMAIWRATDGAGFDIFDAFSKKSGKYDARETLRRWNHYHASPPTKIGAGTLFHFAFEANPFWRAEYDAAAEAQVLAATDAFSKLMLEDPTAAFAKLGVEVTDTEKTEFKMEFIGAQAEPDFRRAEQIARNIEIGDEVTEPILPTILTLDEMLDRLVFIGSSSSVADRGTGRIRKKESCYPGICRSRSVERPGEPRSRGSLHFGTKGGPGTTGAVCFGGQRRPGLPWQGAKGAGRTRLGVIKPC